MNNSMMNNPNMQQHSQVPAAGQPHQQQQGMTNMANPMANNMGMGMGMGMSPNMGMNMGMMPNMYNPLMLAQMQQQMQMMQQQQQQPQPQQPPASNHNMNMNPMMMNPMMLQMQMMQMQLMQQQMMAQQQAAAQQQQQQQQQQAQSKMISPTNTPLSPTQQQISSPSSAAMMNNPQMMMNPMMGMPNMGNMGMGMPANMMGMGMGMSHMGMMPNNMASMNPSMMNAMAGNPVNRSSPLAQSLPTLEPQSLPPLQHSQSMDEQPHLAGQSGHSRSASSTSIPDAFAAFDAQDNTLPDLPGAPLHLKPKAKKRPSTPPARIAQQEQAVEEDEFTDFSHAPSAPPPVATSQLQTVPQGQTHPSTVLLATPNQMQVIHMNPMQRMQQQPNMMSMPTNQMQQIQMNPMQYQQYQQWSQSQFAHHQHPAMVKQLSLAAAVDEDFGDFSSVSSVSLPPSAPIPAVENDDFGDFSTAKKEDEDFGDFSSSQATAALGGSNQPTSQSPVILSPISDAQTQAVPTAAAALLPPPLPPVPPAPLTVDSFLTRAFDNAFDHDKAMHDAPLISPPQPQAMSSLPPPQPAKAPIIPHHKGRDLPPDLDDLLVQMMPEAKVIDAPLPTLPLDNRAINVNDDDFDDFASVNQPSNNQTAAAQQQTANAKQAEIKKKKDKKKSAADVAAAAILALPPEEQAIAVAIAAARKNKSGSFSFQQDFDNPNVPFNAAAATKQALAAAAPPSKSSLPVVSIPPPPGSTAAPAISVSLPVPVATTLAPASNDQDDFDADFASPTHGANSDANPFGIGLPKVATERERQRQHHEEDAFDDEEEDDDETVTKSPPSIAEPPPLVTDFSKFAAKVKKDVPANSTAVASVISTVAVTPPEEEDDFADFSSGPPSKDVSTTEKEDSISITSSRTPSRSTPAPTFDLFDDLLAGNIPHSETPLPALPELFNPSSSSPSPTPQTEKSVNNNDQGEFADEEDFGDFEHGAPMNTANELTNVVDKDQTNVVPVSNSFVGFDEPNAPASNTKADEEEKEDFADFASAAPISETPTPTAISPTSIASTTIISPPSLTNTNNTTSNIISTALSSLTVFPRLPSPLPSLVPMDPPSTPQAAVPFLSHYERFADIAALNAFLTATADLPNLQQQYKEAIAAAADDEEQLPIAMKIQAKIKQIKTLKPDDRWLQYTTTTDGNQEELTYTQIISLISQMDSNKLNAFTAVYPTPFLTIANKESIDAAIDAKHNANREVPSLIGLFPSQRSSLQQLISIAEDYIFKQFAAGHIFITQIKDLETGKKTNDRILTALTQSSSFLQSLSILYRIHLRLMTAVHQYGLDTINISSSIDQQWSEMNDMMNIGVWKIYRDKKDGGDKKNIISNKSSTVKVGLVSVDIAAECQYVSLPGNTFEPICGLCYGRMAASNSNENIVDVDGQKFHQLCANFNKNVFINKKV